MTTVTCSCANCGNVFERPLSQSAAYRGLENDYCSSACYDAYRIQPVTVTCQECGRPFTVWRSRYKRGNTQYCSQECKHKGVGKRQTLPPIMATCETCHRSFVVSRSYKEQRFCSSACYGAWRKSVGISAGPNNPMYRYGSTMRTLARLRSAAWKRTADRVRVERGNKCEVCGKEGKRKLLVHHKVPWEVSQDDSDENLLVVCQSCHNILEREYHRTGLVPY